MDTYNFSWTDLGDLQQGRPNLGPEAPVLVYRLMQFTFKDIASKKLGVQETRCLFVKAGELAGRQFCRNILNTDLPLAEFLADLEKKLIDLKIGILRVEKSDMETLHFTVTVSEDIDCSGLPILGTTVCDYDEGFIAGIFTEYTGRQFTAHEVDCWALGERTCRFEIKPSGE